MKDGVVDDVVESTDVVADTDVVSRGDVSMTWLMTRILMQTWQVTWR